MPAPHDSASGVEEAAAHFRAGRLVDAEELSRVLIAGNGADARQFRQLGELAFHSGLYALAGLLLGKSIEQDPTRPDVINNLGETFRFCGHRADAERCYRAALALRPDFAEAHNNLGVVFKDAGRLEESEQCLRRAIALKPDFAMALNNLGTVLTAARRLEEAERYLRQALVVQPDFAMAFNNLAVVLQDFGAHAEAEACYRRALSLDPAYAEACNNLGTLLQERGRHDEAIASYRRALELSPLYAAAYSNLLLCLNYAPGIEPAQIHAEHCEFARRFAPAAAERKPHRNRRDRERRLRIGYVSGDLRSHPVGHFLEPVLAHHDRKRYAVHCYFNHPAADAVSARLRAHAEAWRDVHALSDAAAAEAIRADAIDILVDLSGHTSFNRLPVFARKPAPVQASWLGYPNTTGLDAMDYRITDLRASPKGAFDALHSERLVRLPHCQWCYQPPPECPEVAPAPSLAAGHVAFGAFSNPAKITQQVIELWSRLLALVPRSRLIVAGRGLAAADAEFLARFARHGVAPERLDLQPFHSFRDYLALHREVDLVLDTFPYTGGTTTCHALWMGVPVVTLAGNTVPSRGGASVLGALGLRSLVAKNSEQYLAIANALAADPARLAEMRSGMRKRMLRSPLMDADGFTRALEGAYRAMWRSWCAKR